MTEHRHGEMDDRSNLSIMLHVTRRRFDDHSVEAADFILTSAWFKSLVAHARAEGRAIAAAEIREHAESLERRALATEDVHTQVRTLRSANAVRAAASIAEGSP